MPASGGDRERALGALLSGHIGEVGRICALVRSGDALLVRHCSAIEPIHQLGQCRRGDETDLAHERGFRQVGARQH